MDLHYAVHLKLLVWQAPENVDFPAMINILIVHSQVRRKVFFVICFRSFVSWSGSDKSN